MATTTESKTFYEPQNIDNETAPELPTRHYDVEQETLMAAPQYPDNTAITTKIVDDVSSPSHYVRDPHKLIAYIVPFPKPDTHSGLFKRKDAKPTPDRFLVYTPPPPPLTAPKEGEKEAKLHKVQRKWQEEVREAKMNPAKVKSWKGVKGRAAKGVNYAMGMITSSNLDFLNRVPDEKSAKDQSKALDPQAEKVQDGATTHKTVGLEELVLVYPASMPGTEQQIREEFINSMLRTKSKAERDAIIATGLLPIALAIDMLLVFFGGLFEIDAVWLYSSIKGAKTARSVTNRLAATADDDGKHGAKYLKLRFVPSSRVNILQKYLDGQCHVRDPQLFMRNVDAPTESDMLEAIGWSPSHTNGETKNWEDEQWEISEVKDDLRQTFRKGAKEWDKWCKHFEKDPEKALKR